MHWDYGTTGLDDLMLRMFGLRASEFRIFSPGVVSGLQSDLDRERQQRDQASGSWAPQTRGLFASKPTGNLKKASLGPAVLLSWDLVRFHVSLGRACFMFNDFWPPQPASAHRAGDKW